MNTTQNYHFIKYLVLGILLILIFWVLYSLKIIEVSRNLGLQIFDTKSILIAIAIIAVIGPFIEEVAFRLLMRIKG